MDPSPAPVAVRAAIARSCAFMLILLSQLACQHTGYGGRAYGEVPLGAPVDAYLQSLWGDVGSLDAAERSGRVRVVQDSEGMQSVKVPAAEVGIGVEVAGVGPVELTMSLHDGRIMSAGWYYLGESEEHTVAIALELFHQICLETGRTPDRLAELMYAWPVDTRVHMMGVDLDRRQVVWGIASQKMIGESTDESDE